MSRNVPRLALSSRKQKAVDQLANGVTVQATATEVGVARRTIARWRQDPEFQATLRTAVADVAEQHQRQLAAASGQAIGVLIAALGGTDLRRTSLDATRYVIDRTYGRAAQSVALKHSGAVKSSDPPRKIEIVLVNPPQHGE